MCQLDLSAGADSTVATVKNKDRRDSHLCEASDSKQAVHGARALISVHCAQLCIAQGQVPVAVLLVLVHSNVERAVHWPQLVQLLLYLYGIHTQIVCWLGTKQASAHTNSLLSLMTNGASDGHMTGHAEGDSIWRLQSLQANCMIYV